MDLWEWVHPPRCLGTWYMSRGWQNSVSSTFRKANRRCHCCLQLQQGRENTKQKICSDMARGNRQKSWLWKKRLDISYNIISSCGWSTQKGCGISILGDTQHSCLSYLDLLCAGAWTKSSTDVPFNLHYSVILELLSPKLKLSLKFLFYYLFSGWYICFQWRCPSVFVLFLPGDHHQMGRVLEASHLKNQHCPPSQVKRMMILMMTMKK